MAKVTTETFIQQAKFKHNNKYTYENVVYKKWNIKVSITCPIHGEFLQTPNGHLNGNGCPKCSYIKRGFNKTLSLKTFIDKANKCHNKKYNYSKVLYKNNTTKVTIICPIHGEFKQIPRDHLSGKGCNKCGREKVIKKQIMPLDIFIKRANKHHNNKFDYSKVTYKTAKIPVDIICPKHGLFKQTPDTHLRSKYGCIKCSYEANGKGSRSNTKLFIAKAKKRYPNKFDYSQTKYKTAIAPIKIICTRCGKLFTTTPNNHLNSGACPKCDQRGFDYNKPAILYYLSVNNGQAYKIGVTNYSIQDRYSNEELSRIKILKTWDFAIGKNAYDAEQYYLKEYKYAKYTGDPLLKTGNTELFNQDVLLLDS